MANSRARRWITGCAVVAILAAATAFMVVTHTYTLDTGSSGWHGPGATEHTAGSEREYRYRFEPNGLVSFGTSLRNPGKLPVRLTGIALYEDPQTGRVLQLEELSMIYELPSPRAVGPAFARPFEPITFEPGSEVNLYLTIRLPDEPMQGRMWFRDLWVGYSVLGMSRVEPVAMRHFIGLDGTKSAN